MTAIGDWWRLVTAASRVGFADLKAIYSLRTWIFGWFGRLVTQVIFFSLFGLLLGSTKLVDFRVVGNCAALACIESMAVLLAVVRERNEGTLVLQVLSPAPFALTYMARGACNFIVGIGSSTAAFVITATVFHVPAAMPQALLAPLAFAVMGFTSYCLGLALGAAVMTQPGLQWLAVNAGYLSVMTFAGVNVPVSYWPRPLQIISQALPLTHGLDGLRVLLAGGSYQSAFAYLGLELLVGACWLTFALTLLLGSVRLGCKRGTLELSAG